MTAKITSGESLGGARARAPWSRPASGGLVGDIARFGTATLLAATFGAVQVFLIPRRLDMTTYGQYRLFLLYVGYLGVLHFGLADGAFVRWAGRPRQQIGAEWRRVVRWLIGIQGAVLGLTALAAGIAAPPLPRLYLISLAACALFMNATTLAGYALQASGDFRQAARVAVLAPAIFVTAAATIPMRSLETVLAAYVASHAVAAILGSLHVARAGPRVADDAVAPTRLDVRSLLRGGLPVLGANLAAGISQFADRIMVSMSVPITSFAMYGFASSVMVAASVASHALSRVALSHAAWRSGDGRAQFLTRFYDLVASGFGIALGGTLLFEHLVARWLPAYVPALPIVRALAIGAPFWVAIHVVLVGTLQSYGMVRRQLALELLGLALVAMTCGAALSAKLPLWSVAASATAAAAVTWSVGVVFVRRFIPAARDRASIRFVLVVGGQSMALLATNAMATGWVGRTLVYAALAAFPTWMAARAARAQWSR